LWRKKRNRSKSLPESREARMVILEPISTMKIKLITIGALCSLVFVITAATTKSKPADGHYTNLQVLPKDISPKDMQKIMVGEFEDALGVSCGFCHAKKDSTELDYASDAKPEKMIARQMLKMTLDLNKKYFKIDSAILGTPNIAVTCNTCHRGDTFPEQPGNGKN